MVFIVVCPSKRGRLCADPGGDERKIIVAVIAAVGGLTAAAIQTLPDWFEANRQVPSAPVAQNFRENRPSAVRDNAAPVATPSTEELIVILNRRADSILADWEEEKQRILRERGSRSRFGNSLTPSGERRTARVDTKNRPPANPISNAARAPYR